MERFNTMLEKILAAFKGKAAPQQVEAPASTPEVKTVDPAVLADMAKQLEDFVYDSEVASELAPVFVAMSAVEGFDKVLELLNAKEKQIEAISNNTAQQSTPEVKQEQTAKSMTAVDILKQRNS